jgi:hypothetical protein
MKRLLTTITNNASALALLFALSAGAVPAIAQSVPVQGAPVPQTPSNAPSTLQTSPLQAPEVQIPFDTDGNIWTITQAMEQQYGFLREYPNVVEARLYQAQTADSSYTLELTQFLNGRTQRTRIPLSREQTNDLRSRVVSALQVTPTFAPEERLTDWEKTSLAISAGLLGLYYGIFTDATVLATQNTSGSTGPSFGTATLLTPLLFAGGAIWATNQSWFNRSSALMLGNGLTLGFLRGIFLYGLIGDVRTGTGGGLVATGVLTAAAEAGFGMTIPTTLNLNYGQTTVLTGMGATGLLAGVLMPATLGAFDNGSNGWDFRGVSAVVLGLSAAGYYGGYLLGQSQHFAGGDGLVFGTPATLGLLLPLSVTFLNNPQTIDGKLTAGLSLLTHGAGYVLGGMLIKDKDFSFQQGRAISSATGLGVLAGLLPSLADRSGQTARLSTLLMVLGGGVGFGISYALNSTQAGLNDRTRRAANGSQSSLWMDEVLKRTSVEVSPMGMLGMAAPQMFANPALGAGLGAVSLPILTVRYTPESPREQEVRQLEQIEAEERSSTQNK